MKLFVLRVVYFLVGVSLVAIPGFAQQDCVECHTKESPNIVTDWQLSTHATGDVDCVACHGDEHKTADDFANVGIPTPETCAECHQERVDQFKAGKHAFAWAALKAMPSAFIHAWLLRTYMLRMCWPRKLRQKGWGEMECFH